MPAPVVTVWRNPKTGRLVLKVQERDTKGRTRSQTVVSISDFKGMKLAQDLSTLIEDSNADSTDPGS